MREFLNWFIAAQILPERVPHDPIDSTRNQSDHFVQGRDVIDANAATSANDLNSALKPLKTA